MTKTIELGIVGVDTPIAILHIEDDDSRVLEIPTMHLSEDLEWVFDEDLPS